MKITAIACLLLLLALSCHASAKMDSTEAKATYDRAVDKFKLGMFEEGLLILDSARIALKNNGLNYLLVAAENDRVSARRLLGDNPLQILNAYYLIEREHLPLLGEGSIMHAKTYFNIANALIDLGDMISAQDYLLRSETIMETNPKATLHQRALVFSSLALTTEFMGNKESCVAYTREAIRLMEEVYGALHPVTTLQRVNLLKTYIPLRDMRAAEEVMFELNVINAALPADQSNHKAMVQDAKIQMAMAAHSYQEADVLLGELKRSYPTYLLHKPYLLEWFRNKSLVALALGQPDLAESLLLAAVNDTALASAKGELFIELHRFYLRSGKPSLAVEYAQKARGLYFAMQPDTVENLNDLVCGVSRILESLKSEVLALHALADSSGDLKDRQMVLDAVEYAEQIFSILRRKAKPSELMRMRERGWFSVYECGMKAAFELYKTNGDVSHLAKAWTISENAKSATLLSSINRVQAFGADDVPLQLIARERDVRTELAYYETLIDSDHDIATAERIRLVRLNQSLDSLMWLYERDFPGYTRKRFSPPPASLEQATSYAQGHDLQVWSYFFGDNGVYAITIDADHHDLHYLTHPDTLLPLITRYRDTVNKRPDIQNFQAGLQQFAELSQALFQQVVLPLLGEKGLAERLLIIPDGALNYLPFESLVTNVSPQNKLEYLVESSEVAYAYGLTLLYNFKPAVLEYEKNMLALAPVFETSAASSTWGAISGAAEEVRAVTQFFSSHVLRQDAQNYDWFMEQKGKYRILHLATHAFADPVNPFDSGLLLDGGAQAGILGVLKAADLYHLSIPTELVVLSACNTGLGPVRRGEGVLSLAHGFAYAGSPAVVMALWPANDVTTMHIAQGFYEQLAVGATKSSALAASKRKYLNEADPYQAHPYFWSGMVFIGYNAPLEQGNMQSKYWWLLLLGIIPGVYLFRRYRRPRSV
jgi:CHAT domain-containing protein